jgi:ubiquinone/menaquinone biosynthesis C-methylase UbiE
MTSANPDEARDTLDAGFTSAALAAALELDLFPLLSGAERPLAEVAAALGVPPRRCGYWLELLVAAGWVERSAAGYRASERARRAILDGFSAATWKMLAAEARESAAALRDLTGRLGASGSAPPATGGAGQGYVARMSRDPARARRFTRALLELHEPLARALAATLDPGGGARLLDLGGGSGVMTLALLERHAGLRAVVMDIANVCEEGRRVAAERGLSDRVTYHAGDFMVDPLPGTFDLVLVCDVEAYEPRLLGRMRAALEPGGRLAILDQLAPEDGVPHPTQVPWAMEASLRDPNHGVMTLERLVARLGEAGFATPSVRPFAVGAEFRPAGAAAVVPPRHLRGFTLIEAARDA